MRFDDFHKVRVLAPLHFNGWIAKSLFYLRKMYNLRSGILIFYPKYNHNLNLQKIIIIYLIF